MRLHKVLKLAPIVGFQTHLVNFVQDLGTLINGQLLEHLVEVGALTRYCTSLRRKLS